MKSFYDLKSLVNGNANETYVIIGEFPKINYTLIYRGTTYDPWIVAYGYNKENRCWDQGRYYEKLEDAMAFISDRLRPIPYERMSEIASKAIDGLIEDDDLDCIEEELDLDNDERDYFGITEWGDDG